MFRSEGARSELFAPLVEERADSDEESPDLIELNAAAEENVCICH